VSQRSIINGKANLFLVRQRVVLVKEKITSFILSQKQRYGNPRMTVELAFRQCLGITVAKYMNQLGLQ
jgi:hypothetical protein